MPRLLLVAALLVEAGGSAHAIPPEPPPPDEYRNSHAECAEIRRQYLGSAGHEAPSWLHLLYTRRLREPLVLLLPNPGVVARRDTAALTFSWTLSLPFGPDTSCVAASWSQGGSSLYRRYRAAKPLRVVIEPGFAIAVMSNDAWLFVRPGLRYIWQRLPSGAGIGAGIGSTFSWAQYRGGAASLSPELLLQSGSPHLLIAIRFEHPVAGREPAALVASIGATVW